MRLNGTRMMPRAANTHFPLRKHPTASARVMRWYPTIHHERLSSEFCSTSTQKPPPSATRARRVAAMMTASTERRPCFSQ